MNSYSKPWYASKTVWGIALASLISLAAVFDVQPVEQLPDQIVAALQVVSAAFAFYGRMNAKKKLTA